LEVCRRRAATLALVGLIVFAPLAVLEAFAVGYIEDRSSGAFGHRTLALTAYLGISLLMLGSALCAGLLDTVVGREFGEEDLGWRRAIWTLPYGRLVGVDVAQALIIGSLSILGFVPGLIAFTLTCLAGSLVMIEQRGVRSALRRSATLTRQRFGLTLAVVTVPVAVEHQVLHALTASFSMSFAAAWAVHAVAAVVFLVPVVVVEITLAHHLRRDEIAAQ
jgi:MFS family permease